jgi:cytochrome c biogenesis protein CcdA
MAALLFVLTSIALLDSISIIPLSIVALAVLLAGPKPLLTSCSFILGTFCVYVVTGMALLVGLQSVFEEFNAYVEQLSGVPNTEEIIFQIALGLLLCAFGMRLAKARRARSGKASAKALSPAKAFVVGMGLTFLGMPGGLPYFAAVDLILRAEVPMPRQLAAIVYYNIIFVSPLGAIVAIRVMFGERGQEILEAVKRFFDKWGQKLIVSLLVGLGLFLVADGIGWFLGTALIFF